MWMLGCMEIVEYSNIRLKRFTMTCLYQVSYLRLHQVSYLRLQDELGVCLSYCCLSNTTCVLVVIQYTAVYLVYICHIPKYHYIIVTVVYLVYCIIAVCVEVL